MRPATLHKFFKFDAIRFAGYRIIVECNSVDMPPIFSSYVHKKLLVWLA